MEFSNYLSQKRNCLLFIERNKLPSKYKNTLIDKGKYDNLQQAFETYNETIFSYIDKLL